MGRCVRLFVFALALAFVPNAGRAQLNEVCAIPQALSGDDRLALERRREELLDRQIALAASGERFNRICGSVAAGSPAIQRCRRSFGELNRERDDLNGAVDDFCGRVRSRAWTDAQETAFRDLFRASLDDAEALMAGAENRGGWNTAQSSGFFMGALAGARGRFSRALRLLSIVGETTGHDSLVDRLDDVFLQRALAAAEHPGGPLATAEDLDRRLDTSNPRAHMLILQAAFALGQGDYDRALALFSDAQGAAPGEPATQAAVDKALVWTRQLKAAAGERLAPGALDRLYREQRAQAAAEQAWHLGQALALKGLTGAAGPFYDEALTGFLDTESPGRVVSRQARMLKAGRMERNDEIAEMLAAPRSRTEAVLDALEYGRGDWNRALSYVAERRRILPRDVLLREAQAYLEGLAAGR